ncbi:hypothetical protein HOC80_01335 [archaeon]|jgi:hypothetical protein|nr:hypothetical protein [archaeon]MBT4416724.1 hypothetical protein [archaeon]
MNVDIGKIIKGFFKFIWVLIYSFFKAITVDFYHNFKDKWSGGGSGGYKNVTAPPGEDHSQPVEDYKEIKADDSPSDEGVPLESTNVFDIFK